jgi:ketosteroid isomerase-like protein
MLDGEIERRLRMAESTDAPLDLEAISERYFAAWEARDPDAIVSLHTGDTQFWTHLGTEPVRGREAVRATFADLFVRFPDFGFETHRVLYGPDFWILDWALTFQPEGSDERAQFDCLDVVNISADGLVARKDTFVDMVQLQAALPDLDVEAEIEASEVLKPEVAA